MLSLGFWVLGLGLSLGSGSRHGALGFRHAP